VCYERIILIICDTNLNYCYSALFLHNCETLRVQIRDGILWDGLIYFIPSSEDLSFSRGRQTISSFSFLTWEGNPLTSAAEIGIWSVFPISNNLAYLWTNWNTNRHGKNHFVSSSDSTTSYLFRWGKMGQALYIISCYWYSSQLNNSKKLFLMTNISNFVVFKELYIRSRINCNRHSNQICVLPR